MGAAERSVARFGNTLIPFEIRRSSRRQTVSIAVDATAHVLVTAPQAAPVSRLDELVRKKGLWILERLRRKSELPSAPPATELVSGTTCRYLGRQYRLQVQRGAEAARVALRGSWLVVSVPSGLPAQQEAEHVRDSLILWYRTRAAEYLTAKVHKLATKVGVAPTKVMITDPPKRWGSAAKDGTLRLNWRIVQAPLPLVEYVVVHELVHLAHPDHGRAFWAKVGRVLPDYEQRRERLRVLGPSLVW